MVKQLRFYRDNNDTACANGPVEEHLLTHFLEVDIQEDTLILQTLLDDLWAIENGHDDMREFTGNAHTVTMTPEGVTIENTIDEDPAIYRTNINHFQEVLQNWEAFI